jgi:uncharacterized RDD family membrane protein YckC
MAQPPDSPSGLGYGAIYAMQDRLGLIRRLCIFAVDFILIQFVFIAAMQLFWAYSPKLAIGTWVLFTFGYLVILKTYSRTLGYYLMGAKLVDIRGNCPGIFRVIFRLLLANASHPLLDPIWFEIGKKRALRDLLAGTYVVKNSAQPLGQSEIRHSYLFALSYSFMYREVVDGSASKLHLQTPVAKN